MSKKKKRFVYKVNVFHTCYLSIIDGCHYENSSGVYEFYNLRKALAFAKCLSKDKGYTVYVEKFPFEVYYDTSNL